MIDLIGDIHGHSDKLEELLLKLGYAKINGAYAHPDRKVLFVGDYIDRGPKIRETLQIVKAMVDNKNAIALIDAEEANIMGTSASLAEKLMGKIPAIYSTASYEGVGIRFRQQIDENSKMLCWHHVFPEMNHNELVGWTTPNDDIAVVFLRNNDDYTRTQKRMDLCKEIFKKYTPHVFEIWSKGESQLEKSFYLIHYGDWVSWYLSELKNIDCSEVKVIDYLKGELSKV